MTTLGFQLYSARNFQPFSGIYPKLQAAGYGEVEVMARSMRRLPMVSLMPSARSSTRTTSPCRPRISAST